MFEIVSELGTIGCSETNIPVRLPGYHCQCRVQTYAFVGTTRFTSVGNLLPRQRRVPCLHLTATLMSGDSDGICTLSEASVTISTYHVTIFVMIVYCSEKCCEDVKIEFVLGEGYRHTEPFNC